MCIRFSVNHLLSEHTAIIWCETEEYGRPSDIGKKFHLLIPLLPPYRYAYHPGLAIIEQITRPHPEVSIPNMAAELAHVGYSTFFN